mmetsp:Transcript_14061/g.25131  ORF Transcript_14061/g.25131 Transcript_14061/m.25131 type:complete len:217 (-) Transcript_14061:708-1358(-)
MSQSGAPIPSPRAMVRPMYGNPLLAARSTQDSIHWTCSVRALNALFKDASSMYSCASKATISSLSAHPRRSSSVQSTASVASCTALRYSVLRKGAETTLGFFEFVVVFNDLRDSVRFRCVTCLTGFCAMFAALLSFSPWLLYPEAEEQLEDVVVIPVPLLALNWSFSDEGSRVIIEGSSPLVYNSRPSSLLIYSQISQEDSKTPSVSRASSSSLTT